MMISDPPSAYPRIDQFPKQGDEVFHRAGKPLQFSIVDFWKWSASGFLGNAQRGVLAEYLVAEALGVATGLRTGWEQYDLETPEGVRVEVKASAYIQEWHQSKRSSVSFGIRANAEAKRNADVYVFCLLHHVDQETVDPMDLQQWTFYVLATSVLNEMCPDQKTTGLSGLLRLGAVETAYAHLADVVNTAARGSR